MMARTMAPGMFTRREFMVSQALLRLADDDALCAQWGTLALCGMAREAVSSVAIEHPEWDMEEVKSMSEWEEEGLS